MSFRQSLACNVSPIFLRLVIGVTFIMAGAGKVFVSTLPVNESNSAALVAMGVITEADAEARGLPLPAAVPQSTDPAAEDESQAQTPGQTPADPPEAPGIGSLRDQIQDAPSAPQADPATDPQPDPSADEPPAPETNQPTDEPASDPANDPTNPPGGTASIADPTIPTIRLAQAAPTTADPITIKNLNSIALRLYNGANPGTNEDGSPKMPLVPAFAANGSMPVTLAWVAALTELVAGVFLILGLLTRISALSIAGTMAVAAWLTVIGPAIQSGNAVLGFLPDTPWYDVVEWKTFLWQMSLLAGSITLFFSSAGSLSLDRLLFGPMAKRSGSDD